MVDAAARSRGTEFAPEPECPNPAEIRDQLRHLLDSPAFHRSTRCQQFLEYVCEKALAGEGGTLKERTVATEVFGRQPESDLGEDTIVRVGAREVRKRLAQYYVTPEGAAARVRIDLPPGQYVPEFRYAEAREVKEAPPPFVAPALQEQAQAQRSVRLITAAGFLLVFAIAAIAVAKWTAAEPATEAFRRFWDPVFQAPEPLLVAVGHPLVYHPSMRALLMSEQRLPAPPVPMQRPIQLPPKELNGSDLVPVVNQYVGFGDMVAATEVAAMLGRKSKTVRVRMASGTQFADLRQAPALLIGAITNRWTMELGQNWRFRYNRTLELTSMIVDTAGVGGRQWSVAPRADGLAPEDYILVSRIRNSTTGNLLMVAAGLKQFGTEAAGRLLTDPQQLGVILGKLPAGWEHKNLQIVLHTKVIGNTPAQPEVVASHVW